MHRPTLRLSGSSERPAYPGFMVMNTLAVAIRRSSTPSNQGLTLVHYSAQRKHILGDTLGA